PDSAEGLANRPEARNLVGIMAALLDTNAAGILVEHGGKGFGAFKEALAEVVVSKLVPIASETTRLLSDKAEIDRILRDGASRAAAIANPIVEEAERLVGLLKV
ncbi:MAG: tryptophan--tRNA ligase, partial [Pseudomonadota bacterium]|nr:tryptophan--tRNA ligase [Pseudomonadota bacterium]